MDVLYFILLIGVLIFVHEVGHFIFAKLFNVKVLKFSLGFGPRALGLKKGETEYVVAWFPLGGYVKMLGSDPEDEVAPCDQGRALHQQALWKRYIIVLAGPVFNLIFPTIIYFVFYAATPTLPPAVMGKVFAGEPAAEGGLKAGDKIVQIDGTEIRYWDEMKRVIADNPSKRLCLTIEREGRRLRRYITPEVLYFRDRLGFQRQEGRIGIAAYFEPAQIGITDPLSPAGQAGLRTGDLITAVNGKPVSRWWELEQLLQRNRGQSLLITYLRSGTAVSGFADLRLLRPLVKRVNPQPKIVAGKQRYYTGIEPGEFFVREVEPKSPAAKIGMKPGDRVLTLDGKAIRYWEAIRITLGGKVNTARKAKRQQEPSTLTWVAYGGEHRSGTFRVARETYLDDYKQEQERYIFGAKNGVLQHHAPEVPVQGRFGYAVTQSIRQTGKFVGVIALAVVQMFRGAIPADNLGGVVMLYKTAGVAARKGWDHFLSMMALISINLGILNLLPVPILDGGHLMFFTLEAIRRRPLSLRAREIASYVGLILLVSLMVFALRNDAVRFWLKK